MKITYPPTTPYPVFRDLAIGGLCSRINEPGVFLKTALGYGRELGATSALHPVAISQDTPIRIVAEIQITYQP